MPCTVWFKLAIEFRFLEIVASYGENGKSYALKGRTNSQY